MTHTIDKEPNITYLTEYGKLPEGTLVAKLCADREDAKRHLKEMYPMVKNAYIFEQTKGGRSVGTYLYFLADELQK